MHTLLASLNDGRLPRTHVRRVGTTIIASVVLLSVVLTSHATAQVVPDYQGYSPLSDRLSPGTAANWAAIRGRATPDWFQPIQIIVDDDAADAIETPATVTVYHERPVQGLEMTSPAQLAVRVGHSYRLRITNLDGLPGVEIYPTIEMLDRLHPPAGQKDNFPIPIHIDRADIETALAGNLVTRVVYLEQPQLAMPFEVDVATRTRSLTPRDNAISEADRYGRPMAIVRIGGRLPVSTGEAPSFYGTGGPIDRSQPTPATSSEETAE